VNTSSGLNHSTTASSSVDWISFEILTVYGECDSWIRRCRVARNVNSPPEATMCSACRIRHSRPSPAVSFRVNTKINLQWTPHKNPTFQKDATWDDGSKYVAYCVHLMGSSSHRFSLKVQCQVHFFIAHNFERVSTSLVYRFICIGAPSGAGCYSSLGYFISHGFTKFDSRPVQTGSF
jgi:hypothetical protein